MTGAEDIAEILRTVQRIEKMLLSKGTPSAGVTTTAGPAQGVCASDADLDGEYGDPEIRKDPPRWTGESFATRHYSQSTPEFLDNLAGFLDWKAGKDDEAANASPGTPEAEAKVKYARWARKDAARARGWAKRLRAGWKPAAPAAEDSFMDGDDGDPFP